MMNAASSALPARTSVSAVIRRARPSDAAALTRLFARANVGGDDAVHAGAVRALFATGHLFVLDAALGELGAAAHVELGRDTGHLDFLVIDPSLYGQRLEARIIGVAEAFCEAWGRGDMDVTAKAYASDR